MARLKGLAALLGVAGGAVLVLALFIRWSGHAPAPAFRALFEGSVGDWYAFASGTAVRAIPLALTGFAVAIAWTAGLFNVGAEGQLLAGATAATLILLQPSAASLGGSVLLVALLGAGIAGAGWAVIPAVLKRRFGVLEVISTILLNFVALYAVGYLVRGPLQEPTHAYPQSSTVAESLRLGVIVPGTRLHVGALAVLGVGAALWGVLRFTALGFRLRVVGTGADAARSAGRIDVERLQFGAFLVSGALAGFAGGVEVAGVTYALYEDLSPGYGYMAIAVALLGGLHPLGVILAALFIGGLESGAAAMQRNAGVPSVTVQVIEAVLVLAVLALRQRSVSHPRVAAPAVS